MKKTLLLIVVVFSLINLSCSNEESEENISTESKIDVTINGVDYTFNTFTIEKHFEDPDDKWYEVIAKINNQDDLVIEFDVDIGFTGEQEGTDIIGEFNLYRTENNEECAYYAPDTPYPDLNVTVNTEEEFVATFAFSNGYGVYCDGAYNSEDEVTYTDGSIYLNL